MIVSPFPGPYEGVDMRLKQLKCPNCGANLVPKSPSDRIIMCDYCGTVVYIEEDEKKVVYVGDVSQKERGETELALISLRSGNYEDAKRKFEEAISNNLRNNVAWLGKAAADLHLGNLNESALAFLKAIELGTPPETIIAWANYLIATAAYYESRYYSISRSPDQIYLGNAERYRDYAMNYGRYRRDMQSGLYNFIRSYLEKQGETKDEQLLGYALQLAMNNGDYENMYEFAERILSRDPESKMGRYYKGVAALYLGRPQEAADLLYPLLQEMPSNYNVYVFLGYAYSRLGHYEYACDLLLGGYTRLRNTAISSALVNTFGEWHNRDPVGARNWRHVRRKELKAWGINL